MAVVYKKKEGAGTEKKAEEKITDSGQKKSEQPAEKKSGGKK